MGCDHSLGEVGPLRRWWRGKLLLRYGCLLFRHLLRGQDRGHSIMLFTLEELPESSSSLLVDPVDILGLFEGLTSLAEIHLEAMQLLSRPALFALSGCICSL